MGTMTPTLNILVQAETATIDQLGTARKITIRATETTIIADAANKEEINMRVKQVGCWSECLVDSIEDLVAVQETNIADAANMEKLCHVRQALPCASSMWVLECVTTKPSALAGRAVHDPYDVPVLQIKKQLAETDSVYDSEKLAERIAKLAGGVAVIKVRVRQCPRTGLGL